MALDATKENFLHQTTMYRSKIKPTLTLSSNIHYQNYGHQGLFPVITSRSARYWLSIGQFFVAWDYWPIGGQAQAEGLCVGVTQRDTNLGSLSLWLGILDSHWTKFGWTSNWINSQIKFDLTSELYDSELRQREMSTSSCVHSPTLTKCPDLPCPDLVN